MFRRPLSQLVAAGLLGACLMGPAGAHAYPVGQASLDAVHWDAEQRGTSASAGGARLTLGTKLNDRFAVEVHAAGLGSDTTRAGKVSLDSVVGVYAKAYYPFSRHFRAYALLGAAQAKLELEPAYGGERQARSESGVSWGLGLEFDADTAGRWAVRLDHMRYVDMSDLHLDVTGLGLLYRF